MKNHKETAAVAAFISAEGLSIFLKPQGAVDAELADIDSASAHDAAEVPSATLIIP